MNFLCDPGVFFLAILLDCIWGDPYWLPHPVIYIGKMISWLEALLRGTIANKRFAGVLLLVITVLVTGSVTWAVLLFSEAIHPLFGYIAAVIIASTTLAARSLHKESERVASALISGDIETARLRLSYIVGRDTQNLEAPEIWRALVETVAENSSDGIIAPMFWLASFGPVAAMKYKAVSTLDSMVGYKNERYIDFGWASARMDDLLNFIPARLTAILMILSAPLVGLSFHGARAVFIRDRYNHPSPNSGHPEAAAAGALQVRLGGAASYGGVTSWKEYIGNPDSPLDETAYRGMIRLMYSTTLLMAILALACLYALKGYHVSSI